MVTTNTDGTTREAGYDGCGCAGGEVVTLTDEGTIYDGVPKRRQQRIYSDVLGRTVKTEVLNWQGGSAYSTTIKTYNARDQVTRTRQFDPAQGTVPSDPNDLSCPDGACQQTTVTYDGYGRVKTKHVPQQDLDTVTTWEYYADDTIQQVTDARGVSKTLDYNGRHLLTSITYPQSLPADVAATANVGYEYDAAGNRKLMTDGQGSMSYQYDQLSRLTTETRTITGVGTYPLSYAYNHANQLTSITDPFSAQVGYTLDTAGRVIRVSGSGFGDVTTYTSNTSNIKYRAWGGQKSVTYGDGRSATTSYDARMRPSAYDMLGLREQFQYYDDGRLKLMTDLDDRNGDIGYPDTARHFSRARSYDHAGRLTSDKGATTTSFPLTQNYAHDPFNNLTSRWGGYYYQTPTSDSASYSNNRRNDSTYHADGQVKHSPLAFDFNFNESVGRDWSYDAAGRMVQVQETVTSPSSVSTYTTSYDGDGQAVRESTTTAAYSTTSYMIRSSVLGGQVLTRLNSAGAKQKTTFNVDGRLMAVQSAVGGNSVIWTHVDPLGLSEAGDVKPVYDALGNYVPWQHYPTAPPNAYPPSSPNYGGLGSSFGSAQDKSCVLNGRPISCTDLAHQIDIGNVTNEFLAGGVAHRQAVQPLGLGMFYVDDGASYTDDPGTHPGIDPETGEPTEVASATLSTSSYYELFLLSVAPQKPSPSPAKTPTPPPAGQGLTPCNKSRLAPYFPNIDLNKIGIHFGFPDIATLTGALLDYVGIHTLNDARAIAIGNDIYFRSKQVYNPDSIGGIADMGHEITHVAQAGRLSFPQYVREYVELRRQGLSDNDAYRFTTAEREAFKTEEIIKRDLTNLRNQLGGDAFWSPCPPH